MLAHVRSESGSSTQENDNDNDNGDSDWLAMVGNVSRRRELVGSHADACRS